MLLSNADINLINRAIRHIRVMAAAIQGTNGPSWGPDAESKNAKRAYDRLMRDDRDMVALRKRLEKGE